MKLLKKLMLLVSVLFLASCTKSVGQLDHIEFLAPTDVLFIAFEEESPLSDGEIFEIEDVDERNKAWLEAKQKYQKDTTL